jgi:integrase/recombinase XerD
MKRGRQNMHIETAISETLVYAENRLAHTTIKNYTSGLGFLKDYLNDNNITEVEDISFEILQNYIQYLRTRPRMDGKSGNVQISTINAHIKAMRICFRYLKKSGKIYEDPSKEIDYIKSKWPIINSLSEIQIKKLVSIIPNDTFVGTRNRLIIHTLLDCGVRISEATGISVEDIDFDRKLIKVLGKGNKERLVPFGETLKVKLKNWINDNRLTCKDKIFFSKHRSTFTDAAIRNYLKKYGKEANIKEVNVRPHVFRHTFAVMFLRNGGSPFVLQLILGHNTLSTTRRYVNLLVEDLQREHGQFGPGDKFNF